METNIFAERLTIAREKKGMSLRALSKEADVSVSAMSQYARGETMPPLRLAIRIAQTLGVSLDWLCGLQEEAAPVVEEKDFETYGDVARVLCKLTRTPGLEVTYRAQDKSKEGEYDLPYMVLFQFWNDKTLYDFFAKSLKYSGLSDGDDDEKELFREWTDGRLKALDGRKIDELPF